MPDSPSPQAISGLIARSVRAWADRTGIISFANPLSLYSAKDVRNLRDVINEFAEQMEGFKKRIKAAAFSGVKSSSLVSSLRPLVKSCFED